ncbi:MAG: mandelate racemase/muconate lactonizing enzyme family protein [Roseibium sp.]|uniref:mandelate racemase/muconate lactonizing enzyme family protein n=1 Tax=Roseibium sp. TaxID=1936156 RepID=UPI001B231559|nr:mandelate racemase/muconate lactonizing enzyme family protein [Roseibium sp.]MBO6895474.1 mandelate racemase/muconate lactonizing enzyme family protein [Roseibium sp.]MBO6931829.1 mandelate racemase/muconate lactonizing enzyme family protein [Roseibium sp.]
MKISRISVWAVSLPLSKPYWLSGGRLKFEEIDSTFVRLETDTGLVGWGEGCPWGHTYLPAHGPGLRAALGLLAPALIGRDPSALDDINRLMDVTLPGHPYAKSPLDIACWDLLGKTSDQPLWRLLGAEAAAPVAINSSISTGSPQEMIADIRTASEQGYRTHSAKIGGSDFAADIERIEAISGALPKGEQVTFDVNRAWTPGVALQVLNAVSARDWIEQPCETLDQCAAVAAQVPQPIMLDECLHTFQDHLDAWRRNACQGVKVKPNRVGGLTKARQIRDFGVSVGWQMHIEDTGGSAFADTAALHLAASTPEANRLASWLCHAHLSLDPVPDQGGRNRNGLVQLTETPGVGLNPDPGLLGDPVAVYGGEQ